MKDRNRPRGSQDEQYARREAGVRMLLSGKYRQAEIAKALGVAHGTVRGWSSKLKAKDVDVRRKGARGRPSGQGKALTAAEERTVLRTIRDKNPDQLKMPFYLWSVGAVQAFILKKFHKKISESGTRKYLKAWGLTVQRPASRYSARNDAVVQSWLKEVYPAIAARAKKEGAEIHWLDEAGVNNQAVYLRGYAPSGQTPVITKPAKRQKISMMSTVTNRGTMRFNVYEGSLKSAELITFLHRLCKDADRKVFVIMDNLPVHHSHSVQAWIDENVSKIAVFHLPPYAPDLNPDEYLNNDLKQNVHRLSGLASSKKELKSNVLAYLRHIQKSPAKVRSFFQAKETKYAA